MIIAACFALPSNFIWSHLCDIYRYCPLFQAVSCVFLCSPLYAIASSYAPDYRSDLPLPSGYDLKALLFVVAFILGAIATKGGFMGTTNYLLEIAPEDRRPSYMAFVRVLQAPTVLMLLIIKEEKQRVQNYLKCP